MSKIQYSLSREEQELIEAYRKQKAKTAFKAKVLSDYSVEEKCALFSSLHALATSLLRDKEKDGYVKDAEHWAFAGLMEILAGTSKVEKDKFWNYWISLGDDE